MVKNLVDDVNRCHIRSIRQFVNGITRGGETYRRDEGDRLQLAIFEAVEVQLVEERW